MVNKDKLPWTHAEDDLIREHYPAMGATAMFRAGLLPGRAIGSIQVRASSLKVQYIGRGAPRTGYQWPADEFAPVWRTWNYATPGAQLRACV